MDEVQKALTETLEAIERAYRSFGPTQMEESWQRFEAPTESEVEAFEAEIGADLPDDYRRFLLANTRKHPFSGNFECLDFEGVKRDRAMMTELLDDGTFDGREGRTRVFDDYLEVDGYVRSSTNRTVMSTN